MEYSVNIDVFLFYHSYSFNNHCDSGDINKEQVLQGGWSKLI